MTRKANPCNGSERLQALRLLFPFGAPNYDTLYALVWGNELVHVAGPDYGTQPPTPHPLADAWGLVVAPLGAVGASTATSGGATCRA